MIGQRQINWLRLLITAIIFSWLFGFPQIFNFPAGIQEALAAPDILDPDECLWVKKLDSNVDADSVAGDIKDGTTLATDDDLTVKAVSLREWAVGATDEVGTAKYPDNPDNYIYIGLRIYVFSIEGSNPALHLYAYQSDGDAIYTTSYVTTPVIDNWPGWYEFDVTNLAQTAMGGFAWFKFRMIVDSASVNCEVKIAEVEWNLTPCSFSYRRQITIDYTKVGLDNIGTLPTTGFPVLIGL